MTASVTALLGTAFAEAKARRPDLWQIWTSIGLRVGGLLPNSALGANVQQLGDIDIFLRALEEEFLAASARDDAPADIFSLHYQTMLSASWVSGFYEILRLLRQREVIEAGADFIALLRDFELLRMPLDKHEIAKDKSLKQSLRLQRFPPGGDAQDEFLYDPADRTRAHIMPCGVSSRGSIMWHVIDVRADKSCWIERQDLSDRIIAVFDRQG